VSDVCTFAVVGKRRIEVARIVHDTETLLLYGLAVFFRKVTLHLRIIFFEEVEFVGLQRRTKVALDAATTLARREVADKILKEYVFVD
jgi:hypothetical protein